MEKELPLQAVKTRLFILSFFVLALAFSSCQTYQKIVKSTDLEFKYTKAKEYYNSGDYSKALPLFEELITLYKGTKSIDEIYYMYANCHYYQSSYLVASFHYKNIHDSYPLSKYSEECLFMYAKCHYKISPEANLDQTYTEKGLEAFQLYISSYPKTERMEECNTMVDQLRRKLEMKAFSAAELYFKMQQYQAAAESYDDLLSNYPDTDDAEYASFKIIRAYFLYAQNSYKKKQAERYQLALTAYKKFVSKYSSSEYLGDANNLYETALERIEQLKTKDL